MAAWENTIFKIKINKNCDDCKWQDLMEGYKLLPVMPNTLNW